jgi:hypothetical protein
VLSGRDNSLSGVNFDRPNVNGNPGLPTNRSRAELINRYFDTTVFSANLPGTFGNAGRGVVTGPGNFGWDTSMSKAFRLIENHSLQFRWDAFNLINRPNLGSPNSTLTSPSFGRIQSAGSGRVMQVSLKYTF